MSRILVIDDEESILYTFDCFLADEGHEVLTARDYGEAMKHFSETDFDVVFSDIVLGGKTGLDVLREVRGRGLVCPVAIMTGYPDLGTATEAVRLGAFDYIAKPVVQDTLLRVTEAMLERKRAVDERAGRHSHLDAILMSVEDAVISLDGELRVRELNDAAGSICGLSRNAVGRRLAETDMPCKERLMAAAGETMQSMRCVRLRSFECRREDLPPLVLSASISPLMSRQGSAAGVVMVVRDETGVADPEACLRGTSQFHGIVGKSEAMRKIYSLVDDLADVDTTVLVTGETGTGKELVAEALHHRSARSGGPFVKVNCAALSENLLESELFGHVKGAFTGAAADRIGRFRMAHGGTILLDEIGDISHRTQLSLLRVLQEKEIERVGESRPTKVDVRVVACTNRDLKERVALGQFREDLYFRLKVIEISLPPLRDRREDIRLLVEHFVEKLGRRLKREITGVSLEVEELLTAYQWPGNVRELEHVLERSFILCRKGTICVDHLPPEISGLSSFHSIPPIEHGGADARAILRALEKAAWNKAKAARLLGFDRKTLYRKMARHGIPLDETPLTSH